MAKHELNTEIDIAASPERVWAVLTDFAAYPEWNPFIRSLQGSPRSGERLQVTIQPGGAKAMRFSPVVLTAEPGRELKWRGRLLLPGIFDGEHRFLIEPSGEGGTLFKQTERFGGLLVGPLRASLDKDTLRGFVEMNQALKQRAEQT